QPTRLRKRPVRFRSRLARGRMSAGIWSVDTGRCGLLECDLAASWAAGFTAETAGRNGQVARTGRLTRRRELAKLVKLSPDGGSGSRTLKTRQCRRGKPSEPVFQRSQSQAFHGEFDPGSGRTLAACLRHASRAGLRGFGPEA